MAGIVHAFSSTYADPGDATKIKPSNWNADHTITGDVDFSSYKITWASGATLAGAVGTFDGFFPIGANVQLGSGDYTVFKFESTAATAGGPFFVSYHNSASPAANDEIGGWTAYGNDSAGNPTQYGVFSFSIDDPTNGSEDSRLDLKIFAGGSYFTALTLDGSAATIAKPVLHTGVAFASLPTGVAGMVAYVTDSNTNTWGATIAGGGANKVLAFYNGTNWTVAGK